MKNEDSRSKIVDFRPIKRFALQSMNESELKELLLSEPDEMRVDVFLAKINTWLRLQKIEEGGGMKKVIVALPDHVWDVIDRDLKGKLGAGYSEIIRTIVLNWLGEKGYLSKVGKTGSEQPMRHTRRREDEGDSVP
jgi:hypothetical protein